MASAIDAASNVSAANIRNDKVYICRINQNKLDVKKAISSGLV